MNLIICYHVMTNNSPLVVKMVGKFQIPYKKVKISNDQEMAKSERNSTPKPEVGKTRNNQIHVRGESKMFVDFHNNFYN